MQRERFIWAAAAARLRRDSFWTQTFSYMLAVCSVAAMALVHETVLPQAAGQPAPILFLLPILISAYVGGLGPGLLALLLSLLSSDWFTLAPAGSLGIATAADRVRLAALAVVGSVAVLTLEALHRARRRARSIQRLLQVTLGGVGDGVLSTDPQGRIRFLNGEAARLTGTSAAEALGRPLAEVVHLIDEGTHKEKPLPSVPDALSAVDVGLLLSSAGGQTPVERQVAPILPAPAAAQGLVVVLRDTSAQRQAEQALRDSEKRYRLIVESITDVIWVLEVASLQFSYVSPSVEQLCGFTVPEILSQNLEHLLTPESLLFVRARIPERVAAFERGESVSYVDEIAQPHKNGATVWTETHTRFVRDEVSGRVEVYGVSTDITARRSAENALQESRESYASLFHSMLEGFAYCRMEYVGDRPVDWVYLGVNPAFERLTGLHSAVGRRVSELIPGIRETDLGLFEIYGRVARSAVAERFEMYVASLDIWFAVSAYSPAPEHFVAVFDNITTRKQAEAASRASEERLRLALEAAHAGAWVWDLETNTNIWSDELWELYGLQPHSVEPSYEQWSRTVHPDDQAAVEQSLREAVSRGADFDLEWRVRMPGEAQRWVLARGRAKRDAAGLAKRYLGMVIDITERKLAERALGESEARFRALFDHASDAIFLHGFDGRIVDVNQQACASLQYSREELLGMTVVDVDRSFGLPQAQSAWLEVRNAEVRTVEGSHHRKDGTEFPVEVRLSRCSIGGRELYLAVVRDVTERRRAEQALKQWNAGLERLVAERTLELQAANRELEAFSYSVSHDLRAPLRAIDGFTRVVQETEAPALSPPGRAYLERVRSAAGRMAALIDDLLGLSRITRSDLAPQSVDFSALAESIASELREREPERAVEFHVDAGIRLTADARLLRILLENLLGNAWKFTSRTAAALIEVGSLRDAEGRLVCYVRDNGAGFDMKYAAKLFGAFQRLHSSTEFPGTGIGLATVQRVVNRHGGRVWAEGRPGSGATVFFCIPG